jgi:hypothetical protein
MNRVFQAQNITIFNSKCYPPQTQLSDRYIDRYRVDRLIEREREREGIRKRGKNG